MILQPRIYRSEHDLEQIKAILVEGRKAANGSYYVHPGDLSWWLFYTTPQDDLWPFIYVWEDSSVGGELAGWTLFSPRWRTFDVFIRPGLRGSEEAAQMFAWSVAGISKIVKDNGGLDIRTMWIAEGDSVTIALLEKLGFHSTEEYMLYKQRSLQEPIPEIQLPVDYRVRSACGEQEVQNRAAASYAAFGSAMPFEQYWQRALRFMHSPVYTHDLDIVAVAPDGQIAAFCIAWLDSVNQVGLFEPVGTHPAYQRLGLGKAVLFEGMRRMNAKGMTKAMVCVEYDNLTAQRLYESAGLRTSQKLVTYAKPV